MALVSQQEQQPPQKDRGGMWLDVWAVCALIACLAIPFFFAYTGAHSVLSKYADWSAMVTNLSAISFWICLIVLMVSCQKLLARRQPAH